MPLPGRSARRSPPPSGFYGRNFHRWPSLRAVFGIMIPCCGCQTISSSGSIGGIKPALHTSSTVTGTIFGHRKGRVSFCIQEDPSSAPLLLLEFAISTNLLVKEMQSGILRITLECEKVNNADKDLGGEAEAISLLEEPVWCMYCNGRKVGFAVKKACKSDTDSALYNLIGLMQSVSTGAGVIPSKLRSGNGGKEDGKEEGQGKCCREFEEEDELIYMRASYERVVGSSDSEAFHMISPDGYQAQELSIFLHRS